MTGFKSLRALGIVVVVTALASAAAYAASGSSLKIVLPAHQAKHTLKFSVKGTFTKTISPASLIVLVQAKSRACASTEPKDWKGKSGVVVGQTPESSSPFTKHVTSGRGAQPIRLCAYLYSQMLTSLANAGGAKLLATAHAVIPK